MRNPATPSGLSLNDLACLIKFKVTCNSNKLEVILVFLSFEDFSSATLAFQLGLNLQMIKQTPRPWGLFTISVHIYIEYGASTEYLYWIFAGLYFCFISGAQHLIE